MTNDDSDTEVITLYGGPRDGAQIPWRGGDIAVFVSHMPVASDTDRWKASSTRLTARRATYRRSLQTPTIFTYQP